MSASTEIVRAVLSSVPVGADICRQSCSGFCANFQNSCCCAESACASRQLGGVCATMSAMMPLRHFSMKFSSAISASDFTVDT